VHVFYLHGFASSPDSGKAAFYRERLTACGSTLEAPDFNQPSFSTLTVSRMLAQLDAAIARHAPGPVTLIGSSLGGFLAIHAAARHRPSAGGPHPVTRLVLLAPAIDFGSKRDGFLSPDQIAQWRASGHWEFFHHAYERPEPVGFALYEDAQQYDAFDVPLEVPTLVFQGRRDAVVKPANVIAWAAAHSEVVLQLLDDDHRLLGHMESMWKATAWFLGLDG
jgi:uncharacterized protein